MLRRELKRKGIVGLWLLLAGLPVSLAGQSPLAEKQAKAFVKEHKHSGLVVALIQGQEVRIRGYGQKSRNQPDPPGESDLFELGSLTHTFTVLAMLSGQQAGRYLPEDLIQDHLKNPSGLPFFQPHVCVEIQDPRQPNAKRLIACSPKPGAEPVCITFCDLASHTSGLPLAPEESYDWIPFLNREKWDPQIQPLSRSDFLKSLAEKALKFAPGSAFRYSNTAMALLGILLEDIHGLPYDSLLARFVTGPLRMPHTRTNAPESEVLPGYNHRGKPVPLLRLDAMRSAGGLKSNARDLARFIQAHFVASPLAEELAVSLQDRIEVQFPDIPEGTLAGYGWFSNSLQEGSGKRMYWQYGGTAGHRAFMALEPNSQTGVILLTNSTGSLPQMGKILLQSLNP